jgi:hypothetical protein
MEPGSSSFPGSWLTADRFESTMSAAGGAHEADPRDELILRFPTGCTVMIDVALRLLSLANQLASQGRRVTLDFSDGESGAMGYLDRMGLFDYLSTGVVMKPRRPLVSGARKYLGRNANLVEIARISPRARDAEPSSGDRHVADRS